MDIEKCKLERGAIWNWTEPTLTATAPEKFLDICVYFLLNLKKKLFSFLFLKFFLFYFLLKFLTTPPLLLNFHFHIFSWFFSIREKKFSFFSFLLFFLFFFLFLLSFFSFLFLVFLSYFLLKSSNTPLLFLNFHFHFTKTLKKKKREALFLNWTSYIFLNFGFLFLNVLFQRV